MHSLFDTFSNTIQNNIQRKGAFNSKSCDIIIILAIRRQCFCVKVCVCVCLTRAECVCAHVRVRQLHKRMKTLFLDVF